ncbi:hypothetical protein BG015_011786 [Linnemannia schmuckeri]|uniref:Sel1 repeat family protein n=1 Tax=Linnemannia schmuckeri TaxID=64567 RepID=A0A9P5RVM0_9FUNG|nr:hypothetical protein BG015_011786 [Linnemannia schmuckeri]
MIARQNYAPAQNGLGILYQYGLGVLRNHTSALEWSFKAAEQGNAMAQNHLGRLYKQGQGVAQVGISRICSCAK